MKYLTCDPHKKIVLKYFTFFLLVHRNPFCVSTKHHISSVNGPAWLTAALLNTAALGRKKNARRIIMSIYISYWKFYGSELCLLPLEKHCPEYLEISQHSWAFVVPICLKHNSGKESAGLFLEFLFQINQLCQTKLGTVSHATDISIGIFYPAGEGAISSEIQHVRRLVSQSHFYPHKLSNPKMKAKQKGPLEE